MSKTSTLTFSFGDYYDEEYKFLHNQQNRSQFVCELVRAYREGLDIKTVRSRPKKNINKKTDENIEKAEVQVQEKTTQVQKEKRIRRNTKMLKE